jgi:curved DNA-binding protein CbpA
MDSEYVCIDDEYYDPYFILGVARDDSDHQIARAYKERAKKYHPDKAPADKIKKYEKRFTIILESYEFIKRRRETVQIKREGIVESQDFNREFEKVTNPYDFGYGTEHRMANVEDYKSFDSTPVNQFEKKKFSNRTFNRLFTSNKKRFVDESKSRALVHKTSDGFFGYNTADLTNCALVSSFNGLLITGDNFGESGVGYYSNEYSDYKHSYNSPKNPDVVLEVPEEESSSEKEIEKNVIDRYSEYKAGYKSKLSMRGGSFHEQQQQLLERAVKDLEEKEREDKEMIMKYNKLYKRELIKQALEGRLETSPNFLGSLKHHYNTKQIS